MSWIAIAVTALPLRLAAQWSVAMSTDAMTDRVSWTLSTRSVGDDSTAELSWACDDQGMLVSVALDKSLTHFPDRGGLSVQYRFDKKPASEVERWEESRGVLFAPTASVVTLTSLAKTASKLLWRVTGSQDVLTYTFDLYGWAAAFGKLSCEVPPTRRVLDDQVYLEANVDERPERLTGPSPQYPDLLRQAGVTGRVLVQAVIDTTGRAIPSTVRIVQGPHPGFDDAARRVMTESLFRPGRIAGRAVKVLVTLPVDFSIKR